MAQARDVTVIGAGAFGLAVGYACAVRGARVRVVEKRAVGAGSSGGLVGALAPHVPENWNAKKQFQLDSLLMADGFWAGVEKISGISPGYGRLGRLQALDDARAVELARGREVTAAELWQGRAEWRVVEAGTGWGPVSATGFWVHDTLTARLHPRLACESLAGAIRALGGEIVIGESAAQGAVVWATGYEGLADLSADLGKPVGGGVKGQALALRHDAGAVPQIYAGGLHIIAHADGTVAVGSTSEREFDNPDAVDGQVEELHERALAVCPILHGAEVVARWAGVRPRARSRAPMLGGWPGRAGHFIANGGFKIGYGMAPKVAQVMADLVLDGIDAVPEGFRVEDNL